MSTAQAAGLTGAAVQGPFGGALGGSFVDDAGRGRTRVTSKAISRVVTALAAEALGVSTRSVSVRLSDDGGMLAATVSGPIRVASLAELLGAPAGVNFGVARGGSILERAERAQHSIREGAAALTGASISRVTVHLTGTDITPKERVQ